MQAVMDRKIAPPTPESTPPKSTIPEPKTVTDQPTVPISEIGIDFPFPEIQTLTLQMAVGACKLKVLPGAAEPWVAGIYHNPHNALPPKLEMQNGTARISQEFSGSEWWTLFGDELPRFELSLGKAHPYALLVETGASDCALELGGLPLTHLKIRQGAGKFALDFSIPNPQRMEKLEIEGGAASLEMCCLANANFDEMTVVGGAASYKLKFDGRLFHNATVRINAGVSAVEIEVPATTAAQIVTESTIGSIDIGDGFRKENGAFCTAAANDKELPRLNIFVTVSLGAIHLRTG